MAENLAKAVQQNTVADGNKKGTNKQKITKEMENDNNHTIAGLDRKGHVATISWGGEHSGKKNQNGLRRERSEEGEETKGSTEVGPFGKGSIGDVDEKHLREKGSIEGVSRWAKERGERGRGKQCPEIERKWEGGSSL